MCQYYCYTPFLDPLFIRSVYQNDKRHDKGIFNIRLWWAFFPRHGAKKNVRYHSRVLHFSIYCHALKFRFFCFSKIVNFAFQYRLVKNAFAFFSCRVLISIIIQLQWHAYNRMLTFSSLWIKLFAIGYYLLRSSTYHTSVQFIYANTLKAVQFWFCITLHTQYACQFIAVRPITDEWIICLPCSFNEFIYGNFHLQTESYC